MKFNGVAAAKNYYDNIADAKLARPAIWSKVSNILSSLKEELYDYFDIEDGIYIINDFFDKDAFNINKVSVLIEMEKFQLEEMMDAKFIERHISDNIEYYIQLTDEDRMYYFNGYFFKKCSFNIEIKRKYDE